MLGVSIYMSEINATQKVVQDFGMGRPNLIGYGANILHGRTLDRY